MCCYLQWCVNAIPHTVQASREALRASRAAAAPAASDTTVDLRTAIGGALAKDPAAMCKHAAATASAVGVSAPEVGAFNVAMTACSGSLDRAEALLKASTAALALAKPA